MTEEYFRHYLRVAPLSLSLWRTVEARHLAGVKLKKPVLDVGCGFGEFAGVFFEGEVEMGIDVNPKGLLEAKNGRRYTKLQVADARKMPFADESFNSIIAISTLEHIEDVGKVFSEMYRVCRPGGVIAITIATNKVNGYLFWTKLFGGAYEKFYHRTFKHRTVLSKEKWGALVKKAGFTIIESREIISPTITKLFNFFLISAWPSQMAKKITGKRMVYRPKWVEDLLVKVFLKYIEEEETSGGNLFIFAKRSK